ncbi:MAG: YicC/YloC family endoribonuclease [Thermoguttaceae bacterium]|jgi:uncharacterized protein (TIGR00255 family)
MLLSMTGFGQSHYHRDGLAVTVEVRAINNRFFKLTVRASEGYGVLESRIEQLVRETIRRGTVQVNLRIDRAWSADDFQINAAVLRGYREQLRALCGQWQEDPLVPIAALLPLPGVVDDRAATAFDPEADWPAVCAAVEEALRNLAHMRAAEGRAMAADLTAHRATIAAGLLTIDRQAPLALAACRHRLEERLNKALAEHQLAADPAAVIKELALLADRADISEEICRLRSHLDQFQDSVDLPESSGRKLEFLTQEMVREANTIGSKAADIEIAKQVIEIKTALERIREMIQNVE